MRLLRAEDRAKSWDYGRVVDEDNREKRPVIEEEEKLEGRKISARGGPKQTLLESVDGIPSHPAPVEEGRERLDGLGAGGALGSNLCSF